MKNKQLEIACFNIQSAIIAQQNGADRVELCANVKEGGTTPEIDFVKEAREILSIKIHVMIRPRGGNFVYSNDEFERMKAEIKVLKNTGIDGFVFGILDASNEVNLEQNLELVKLAHPLPCTFHRAFDAITDKRKALETVILCGFKTILTAGAVTNAIDGLSILKEISALAKDRIVIMPGGGVRSSNIKRIQEITNLFFFHSSAITSVNGEIADELEIRALIY